MMYKVQKATCSYERVRVCREYVMKISDRRLRISDSLKISNFSNSCSTPSNMPMGSINAIFLAMLRVHFNNNISNNNVSNNNNKTVGQHRPLSRRIQSLDLDLDGFQNLRYICSKIFVKIQSLCPENEPNCGKIP